MVNNLEVDENDIEGYIQNQVDLSANSNELEEQLSFKSLFSSFKQEYGLSDLEPKLFGKIWSRLILQLSEEKTIASLKETFLSTIQPDFDHEQITEFLEKIRNFDFSSFDDFRQESLQKLLLGSKDYLEKNDLSKKSKILQMECWNLLLEHNSLLADELTFLQDFVSFLQNNATKEFLQPCKNIIKTSLNEKTKFFKIVELIREKGFAALMPTIRKLEKNENFYLTAQFFQTVKPFFEETISRKYEVGHVKILKFTGSAYSVSDLDFERDSFQEVHFIANVFLEVDQYLCFPGVNVYIKTPRLLIPNKILINTSGKDNDFQWPPVGICLDGENGKDGKDGRPGESGGNVVIEYRSIDRPKNLIIWTNGGKGARGQNGQNGGDGTEGKAVSLHDFEKNFPPACKLRNTPRAENVKIIIASIKKYFKKAHKAWWTGKQANSPQKIWEEIEKIGSGHDLYSYYLEVETNEGLMITFAFECGGVLYATNSQSYLLIKGAEGKANGRGGACGRGGQGGYPGTITINRRLLEDGEENIIGKPGKHGVTADPGKPGKEGKNGWDMGWLDYPVSEFFGADKWEKSYGKEQDQKLALKAFDSNNSNRVQCPYRAFMSTKDCFIEINGTQLEHPKAKEVTKAQQKERELQHEAKAIKKTVIDVNANHEQQETNVFSYIANKVAELQHSVNEARAKIEDYREMQRKQMQDQQIVDREVSQQIQFIPSQHRQSSIIPEIIALDSPPIWNDVEASAWKKLFRHVERLNNFSPLNMMIEMFDLQDHEIEPFLSKLVEKEIPLKYKPDRLRLEQKRALKAALYKKVLAKVSSLLLKSKSLSPFKEIFDSTQAIGELKKLLGDNLSRRLFSISGSLIGTDEILNALCVRLSIEGFLISAEEIALFINTVFRMWKRCGNFEENLLWLVAANPQPLWIVECALLEIENRYEQAVPDSMRVKLGAVKNRQILFWLIERLKMEGKMKTSWEQFNTMISQLEADISPSLLFEVPLAAWPLVLKMSHWKDKLKGLTKWKKPQDLERVLNHLGTLQITYEESLLTKLFDILQSKRNSLKMDILTKLFEGLYNEQIFLDDSLIEVLIANPTGCWLEILNLNSKTIRQYRELLEIISKNRKVSEATRVILRQAKTILEAMNSNRSFDNFSKTEIAEWSKTYYSQRQNQNQVLETAKENLSQKLAVLNRAVVLAEEFSLRDTQKIAIILFCLQKEKGRVLEQVSTGEGKSLIVTCLAIIRALDGEKVDIISSSSVLAKRDAKRQAQLYKMFGITVGHNCSELLTERTLSYQQNLVVYGEIGNFQRDLLLHEFYEKNILGNRGFATVIVDEVDSMLLDKGKNVCYLTHKMAGFDHLEAVLVYIWNLVNATLNKTPYQLTNTALLREKVINNLYKRITKDELKLVQSEGLDVEVLWAELINKAIIDGKGRLVDAKHDELLINELETINERSKKRLKFVLSEAARKKCEAMVPNFLIPFVEDHLDRWIENAVLALSIPQDHDYVIGIDRTGIKNDMHPNIIPMDRDTGTDQSTSQWEEGLHQFLQLKHGCKLSPISLKAVFISNVSYFNRYNNIFGLTGTLGSVSELQFLQSIYNVEYVTMPTASGKKFKEETPVICSDENVWLERIEQEVVEYTKKRSILVICETVDQVGAVEKYLTSKKHQLFAYKRDYEDLTIAERLECGKVVVATNLAGRGTDFKLSDELKKADGMHVCLTYLPSNKRVEEQAFGRAARSGDPGSGRLIILKDETYLNASPFQMIKIRDEPDREEIKRVATLKENYETQILPQERAFREFTAIYKTCKSKIAEQRERNRILKMRKIYETKESYREHQANLLANLLDQWALWLDKIKSLIEDREDLAEYEQALARFRLQASVFPPPKEFLLIPHVVRLAKNKIAQNQHQEAIVIFKQVIEAEPIFSAAAHYYLAYAMARTFNWEFEKNKPKQKQVIVELKIAKRKFQALSKSQSSYSTIVDALKKQTRIGSMQINSYKEEKKSLSDMYQRFIASIDDVLGSKITKESFVRGMINEKMSGLIYQKLKTRDFLTRMRVTNDYRKEILESFCFESGLSFTKMQSFVKLQANAERRDPNDLIKKMERNFPVPNRDGFWNELLGHDWLVNSKTYFFVDGQSLCQEWPFTFSQEILKPIRAEFEEFQTKLRGCLLKTPEALDQLTPTSTIVEKEAFMALQQNITMGEIFEKQMLTEFEFAEIRKGGKFNFANFDKLQVVNFSEENIDKNDALEILQTLIDAKIIEKESDDLYRLKTDSIDLTLLANINHLKIYCEAVHNILSRCFRYRTAFLNLQREIDKKVWPLKMPFKHRTHHTLLCELIDAEVVLPEMFQEEKSLNMNKLNEFWPKYDSQSDRLETIKITISELDRTAKFPELWSQLVSGNLVKEAKLFDGTKEKIKNAIIRQPNTFKFTNETVSIFGEPLRNNQLQLLLRAVKLLAKETTQKLLLEIFNQLKGYISTLEVADLYLENLYETLGSQAPKLVEEVEIFMLNGLGDLIHVREKRWTYKMLACTAVIFAFGMAQIIAGIAVEVFTVGMLTNVGSGLIGEGISDLFFAVSALQSGYFSWSSYLEHKKASLILTVATGGIGVLVSRGVQISRYGAKFAETSLEVAGKKVAQMCGMELINAVGFQAVATKAMKHLGKNVLKGVGFGLTSQLVSTFVNSNLRSTCNGVGESVLRDIETKINEHPIATTLESVYHRLGAEKGKSLVETHIKAAMMDKNFDSAWVNTLQRTAGYVSRQVVNQVQRHQRFLNTESNAQMIWSIASALAGPAISTTKCVIEISRMKNNLLDRVNSTLLNSSEMRAAEMQQAVDEIGLGEFRYATLRLIRNHLKNEMGLSISRDFVEPIAQVGATYVVSSMAKMIKRSYKAYSEKGLTEKHNQMTEVHEQAKKQKVEGGNDKNEIQKTLTDEYQENIKELKAQTRDATLYAALQLDSDSMDLVSVKACMAIIGDLLGNEESKGCTIEVKGENGWSQEFKCGNPTNSKHICLQMGGDARAQSFKSIWTTLSSEIPELTMDHEKFKQNICDRIENDPMIRESIRRGLHVTTLRNGAFHGKRAHELRTLQAQNDVINTQISLNHQSRFNDMNNANHHSIQRPHPTDQRKKETANGSDATLEKIPNHESRAISNERPMAEKTETFQQTEKSTSLGLEIGFELFGTKIGFKLEKIWKELTQTKSTNKVSPNAVVNDLIVDDLSPLTPNDIPTKCVFRPVDDLQLDFPRTRAVCTWRRRERRLSLSADFRIKDRSS